MKVVWNFLLFFKLENVPMFFLNISIYIYIYLFENLLFNKNFWSCKAKWWCREACCGPLLLHVSSTSLLLRVPSWSVSQFLAVVGAVLCFQGMDQDVYLIVKGNLVNHIWIVLVMSLCNLQTFFWCTTEVKCRSVLCICMMLGSAADPQMAHPYCQEGRCNLMYLSVWFSNVIGEY